MPLGVREELVGVGKHDTDGEQGVGTPLPIKRPVLVRFETSATEEVVVLGEARAEMGDALLEVLGADRADKGPVVRCDLGCDVQRALADGAGDTLPWEEVTVPAELEPPEDRVRYGECRDALRLNCRYAP